jgi:VIT1/CCC1 family predicted Fe2+/Mn2+ transporter
VKNVNQTKPGPSIARHGQPHHSGRGGWLRAAVLGANDGVVSTASLLIGVVAAGATRSTVLIAGAASVVAGAASMAAGEYVSVGSQRDAEDSDIEQERREHALSASSELDELTSVYVARGLPQQLARQVAEELTKHDALGAHLRDELGLTVGKLARPIQAAVISAASFASLALVPIVALLGTPEAWWSTAIAIASLISLAALGALGGYLGGAPPWRAAFRVVLVSALSMALSAAVGRLLGVMAL